MNVALQIHLQHVARHLVVLALAAYVAFQSGDAVVGAAMADAAIRVLYKGALQHLVYVVIIEVMHHTVAKLRGKHFAPLRVGDDEAGRGAGAVAARPQLVAQLLKVRLGMPLEVLLIGFLPLMPAGIEIGLVQVGKKLLTGKMKHQKDKRQKG